MRRVTFSRNYTISLSRTCRCYCKYCAFATHQAHLYSPEQVEAQLEQAVRRNSKELLILTGEMPEVNPLVAERLAGWGHADFTSYVAWTCERALESTGTAFWVDPKEQLIAIMMVQAPQQQRLRALMRHLVYQAIVN